MGTRHFSPVEEKNSRIRWEVADADIAPRLAAAINKNSHGLINAKAARVIVFIPGLILLAITAGFVRLFVRNFERLFQGVEIYIYLFFALAIVFFGVFLLRRYIKFRPYLYPERQQTIWIFRAKCSDTHISGMTSDQSYYANFQKGGGHICIRLQWSEYQANPVGEEYIFFKFNDRTGNRWAAIAAKKLDER